MKLGKEPLIQSIIHSTDTRITIIYQVQCHRDGRLPVVINSEQQRPPPHLKKHKTKQNNNKAQHKSLDHGTVASGINVNAKGFKWKR